MIVYLNRAEALSLIEIYNSARFTASPVNKFFASRAIVRIKRAYEKNILNSSVTDNSRECYERMLMIPEDRLRDLVLGFNAKTCRSLPRKVLQILNTYKARGDSLNEKS